MIVERLIEKIRKNGYKVTPQRLAISELILKNKDHPTAEEIYKKIIKKFPTISLSTVYQVLHLLRELDLITELKFDTRNSRFETDMTPHINAICPKCGKIDDYYSETVNNFLKQVNEEFCFETLNQRIDFYRYCDNCKLIIKNSKKK